MEYESFFYLSLIFYRLIKWRIVFEAKLIIKLDQSDYNI